MLDAELFRQMSTQCRSAVALGSVVTSVGAVFAGFGVAKLVA
jgi:hypothetical protein